MKKILGSLLLIFFQLQAFQLYEQNLDISTKNPYLKEGVKISCTLTQKDSTQTMFFEFSPKQSKNYHLISLKKEDIPLPDMKKQSQFEYILYPLHEGNISIEFDLIIKQATNEDMRSSFTIGQYEVAALRTSNTKIDIKPIILKVKPLPQKVELIGDYKLEFNIDKEEISSSQQINIAYHIKGEGYPKVQITPPLSKLKGVHYFEDILNNSTRTYLDVLYSYALISQESFEIPSINIQCFDPKKDTLYTLQTDTKKIEVKKIDINDILDKEDSYPKSILQWEDLIPYINGILLFFSGFITAKLIRRYKKKPTKPNSFKQEIKNTKTKKALLQLLLSKTNPKFEPYIEKLYKNNNISLSKIKKDILNEQS